MKKRKIPCFCDNEIEIEVPEEIDLQKEPEAEQEILDGSFMSFRCDRCGKVLKPEFPVRIVDNSRKLEFYLLPELERGAFDRGKADYEIKDGIRGRVVIGYPELIEKLKIVRDSLDDRVVEIMKFYLLEKMDADDTVRVYYFAHPNEAMEFHLYGLKEDEVGISKAPKRVYDAIEAALEEKLTEEPFKSILEPPYVSVQKTYREATE